MRFRSTRGGDLLPFREAVSRGYPEEAGFYRPESGVDLRSAVYSPVAGFTDVVTLAASEMLPESLDPRHAAETAGVSFAREPSVHALGDDILVLDLASGPTGSSADYGAAFTAALLGQGHDPAREIVVASAAARDSAALAAAFSFQEGGLPLVLLCEEGRGGFAKAAVRAGGRPVHVIEVRGGRPAAAALERSLAGHELGGRRVVAGGAPTPVRLLGRCLLFIGLFSVARKGLAGDLIVAAPPGDSLGLITGLWAWGWGLPVSAFLLPTAHAGGEGEGGGDPDSLAGDEFLRLFDRDIPLGSLVLRVPLVDGEKPLDALPGGLSLDEGSILAARAARSALAAGLAGHGKIVVPRFADERWLRPAAPPASCALIDPDPSSLEAALRPLL
jgi:hypothetical protein